MNSIECSVKSLAVKTITVLILFFLLPAAIAFGSGGFEQKKEVGKEQVMHEVAGQWLAVGAAQYEKSYYASAEKSLLMAKDYQQYLTDAERKELQNLLDKTQAFITERQLASKQLEKATELIAQDKLTEAKESLDGLRDNEFLAEDQRQKILERLAEIDVLVERQSQNLLSRIQKSDELIRQGQLEEARTQLVQLKSSKALAEAQRELIIKKLMSIDEQLQTRQRKQVSMRIQKVDDLIKQGQFAEAKAGLESIRAEEPLTELQMLLITEKLNLIELQLGWEKERQQITELYNRSVEFYRAGQVEKAREGFNKIDRILAGKTGEDLVTKEPNSSCQTQPRIVKKTEGSVVVGGPNVGEPNVPSEEPNMFSSEVSAKEVTEKNRQVENVNNKIDRKINLLRSYVRAVVKDAVAKAQDYAGQGEFDKAAKKIISAKETVNQNRLHLGEELFNDYLNQLEQQLNSITQQQKAVK